MRVSYVVPVLVTLICGQVSVMAQEGGRRPATVAGCSATDFAKFYDRMDRKMAAINARKSHRLRIAGKGTIGPSARP